MDDDLMTTDDHRQTFTNSRSSSHDISNETNENLSMTVDEKNRRRESNTNDARIRPVKVISRSSLPNLQIKHPYQSNNNELFGDEKRIISDAHVKVSRTNRASLHNLTAELLLFRLSMCARRKSDMKSNRDIIQIKSPHSPVHVKQTPIVDNVKQDSHQKAIASKPVITRVSFSNELPFNMDQNKSHVTVKHVSVNPKKSPQL